MEELLVSKGKDVSLYNGIFEVKVFQNKNNKQFNLPVMKKQTPKSILDNIFRNKDVTGLRLSIEEVITKKNKRKGGII